MPHNNLGSALYAKKDLEGAIVEYREAIRLDPKLATPHYNLGNALYDKKDLESAILEFREAIRFDPKLASAHNNLGSALKEKGDLDGTIACYKKAVELDPENATARSNLAKAERMAAVQDKLPAFLKGEFQPTTNDERFGLVEWCLSKKLYRKLVTLYAEAFTADPKLADDLKAAHRYSAACYAACAARDEGIGAPDDAAAMRQKALGWLRGSLDLWRKQAASMDAAERDATAAKLNWWLADTDLAGVRDPEPLAKLPAAEREEWE